MCARERAVAWRLGAEAAAEPHADELRPLRIFLDDPQAGAPAVLKGDFGAFLRQDQCDEFNLSASVAEKCPSALKINAVRRVHEVVSM